MDTDRAPTYVSSLLRGPLDLLAEAAQVLGPRVEAGGEQLKGIARSHRSIRLRKLKFRIAGAVKVSVIMRHSSLCQALAPTSVLPRVR